MAMDNITLTSGMRQNLFSLQKTAKSMDLTQTRLSTGKKVNSALDDPIAFFAAQGHTQRSSDLAIRKDEMSEAIQTIKAADNGITAVLDLISSAKSLAQSALANQSTSERADLTAQYNDLISQIATVAADSNYKGTNLLVDGQELNITFDESGDSTLTVTGVDGTGGAVDGATDWGAVDLGDSTDAINASITQLDDARDQLRIDSTALSNKLSTITIRQDFTDNMINTLEDGAANLTNADLNEEGANLLMLQTRQQLGTTSLSMASQAAQSVLRLF
ncbi:flagellin [uncultured Desulfosarcina sp.]|uniref:flagellin N-terminal helical domain-containing protein n=1 Tax=uncultured Desulfosarcina sp. TaxID=218289 RepID=UPI0029C98FD3|nr:flagellin [uncultured Desulfosarcina sp.]